MQKYLRIFEHTYYIKAFTIHVKRNEIFSDGGKTDRIVTEAGDVKTQKGKKKKHKIVTYCTNTIYGDKYNL